jgi:hypothetical protein
MGMGFCNERIHGNEISENADIAPVSCIAMGVHGINFFL